jgi:hypothetical protein
MAENSSMENLMLQWLEKKSVKPGEITAKVILIFSEAGLGKTVLACRLGKRVALITNELAGSDSLTNHPDIEKNVRVIPFSPPDAFLNKGYWDWTRKIIPLIEEGKFVHYDGEPFDTIVLDTISGMIADEIQQIVESGVATEKGKVSQEVAGRPDYLVSEKRIRPLLTDIANLRRCSVVMTSHQRVGDKLTPGANTRADAHRAAFLEINKLVSVMAYMTMENEKRVLQVMPTGNGVAVKSRYRFSSTKLTDDEFVTEIEKWKTKGEQ